MSHFKQQIQIINKRQNTVNTRYEKQAKWGTRVIYSEEAKSTNYWRFYDFEIIKKSFIG